MLRAVTRNADGRETLVLGLTDENWQLLASRPILAEFDDVGLEVQLVVFRAQDTNGLMVRAVELGLASESIIATPAPTPAEPRMWGRS